MALAVGAWLLSGMDGLSSLLKDRLRRVWALSLGALCAWVFLSQSWAYVRATQPDVGSNTALQMVFVTAFTLTVACVGLSPRALVGALLIGVTLNALIGGLQVAAQSSIGLYALGEFKLDPARSGISIIQAGGIRWLRPYGLLPHPNILGGTLAVGLILGGAGLAWASGRMRAIGLLIYLGVWWVFLLTFSRGAWLGFIGGALAIAPAILRAARPRTDLRRLLGIVSAALLCGGLLFLWLYRPFIAARSGLEAQSVELRSIADRTVFMTIALVAIDERPWLGVGSGNYPWYASAYLHYHTDYDLRGDYVHHIALAITAEYGFIGLGLFISFLFTGLEASLRALRQDTDPIPRLCLLGAIVAFAIIGLFEHYPWTLIHYQALWLGMMASAAHPPVGNGGAGAVGTDTQSPPKTVVS